MMLVFVLSSCMNKNKSARREFVKSTTLGLSSFVLSPVLTDVHKTSSVNAEENLPQKKLNILCVGAHPGDPEFGCGGTMAKYSDAGNNVIFLYLTRGEAYNPNQSFAQSASLRTQEAETACKILNAKAVFAKQVDANTELNKLQ